VQLLAQESASQLFLAPSAVPYTVYPQTFLSTVGSTTFSASQVTGGTVINDVAILPGLVDNPSNPVDGSYTEAQLAAINSASYGTYFALSPTVDYSASNPGGSSDTVTFNQPGVYFVQLQTDAGNRIFQVLVATAIGDGSSEPPYPVGPVVPIPAPPGDGTTFVSNFDPDPSNPYCQIALKTTTPSVWLVTGLQDLEKAINNQSAGAGQKIEANIVAHGIGPGGGGQQISATDVLNAADALAFQKAIENSVSSLHLYGCCVGAGPAGANLLAILQQSIPKVDAYSGNVYDQMPPQTVTAIASDPSPVTGWWTDANAPPVSCPEPSSAWLVVVGAPIVLCRVHRRKWQATP
jgi:hypothetical protein